MAQSLTSIRIAEKLFSVAHKYGSKADMAKKQLPEGFTGIWIPAELYQHSQLNGSDRELLGAICSFHKSGSKYTDIGYIANLFGVDKSNIRKRVTKLEKSGYLVRDDRNKQTGGSNLISPTP